MNDIHNFSQSQHPKLTKSKKFQRFIRGSFKTKRSFWNNHVKLLAEMTEKERDIFDVLIKLQNRYAIITATWPQIMKWAGVDSRSTMSTAFRKFIDWGIMRSTQPFNNGHSVRAMHPYFTHKQIRENLRGWFEGFRFIAWTSFAAMVLSCLYIKNIESNRTLNNNRLYTYANNEAFDYRSSLSGFELSAEEKKSIDRLDDALKVHEFPLEQCVCPTSRPEKRLGWSADRQCGCTICEVFTAQEADHSDGERDNQSIKRSNMGHNSTQDQAPPAAQGGQFIRTIHAAVPLTGAGQLLLSAFQEQALRHAYGRYMRNRTNVQDPFLYIVKNAERYSRENRMVVNYGRVYKRAQALQLSGEPTYAVNRKRADDDLYNLDRFWRAGMNPYKKEIDAEREYHLFEKKRHLLPDMFSNMRNPYETALIHQGIIERPAQAEIEQTPPKKQQSFADIIASKKREIE